MIDMLAALKVALIVACAMCAYVLSAIVTDMSGGAAALKKLPPPACTSVDKVVADIEGLADSIDVVHGAQARQMIDAIAAILGSESPPGDMLLIAKNEVNVLLAPIDGVHICYIVGMPRSEFDRRFPGA